MAYSSFKSTSKPAKINWVPSRFQWARRLGLALLGLFLVGLVVFSIWTRQYAVLTSPEPSLFLEDRHGQFLSEAGDGPLGFWPVSQVPARLEACLLAVEDRRFYDHGGVDIRALGRAFLNNLTGKPRQGASTIAMQIARLQRPGPRTYARKLQEIFIAWHLLQRYDHQRVLNHYLQLMPQGRRIHGAAYAARRYFQKPLVDISWAEASLLIALLKAPGRMNFYRPEGLSRAKSRANRILAILHQQSHLVGDAYQAALKQLENYQPPEREVRPFHALHAIHRINQVLADNPNIDKAHPIRTSLDLKLQDLVDSLAASTLENLRGRGAGNIAVMVVERETGQVRSYIGSDWYDDKTHAGAINYAHTPRSSGSTLKPFIYALGLETGHFQPNSILADLPLLMVDTSGQYGVTNFDASYLGPMLLRRALANSRNIPAVGVLGRLGIQPAYDFLKRIGLARGEQPADFYGLGMAIGGIYVTLEDLVSAYAVLANDGQQVGLRWFTPAEIVGKSSPLSAATARQITLYLADPQARQPTFPRGDTLEFPFPVAVKTGTSQGFRDAWCLAYSRGFLVGVWIGRADHQPMNKISGTHAARLVRTIMAYLHPEAAAGVNIQPFPKPSQTRAIRLCPLSGNRASQDCDQVALEYLDINQEPLPFTQVHQRFAIDRVTGHQAGPTTPPHRVKTHKALVLPGAYAVWAARKNMGPPPPPHNRVQQLKLQIQMPVAGSRLHLDPSTPTQFQTLPLRAIVEPAVSQVVWYVDGQPFKTVSYPYEARWPLEQGQHHFQVRLVRAEIRSEIVSISISP